jgi:uncharacterized protein YneF (UPF0154 family)
MKLALKILIGIIFGILISRPQLKIILEKYKNNWR